MATKTYDLHNLVVTDISIQSIQHKIDIEKTANSNLKDLIQKITKLDKDGDSKFTYSLPPSSYPLPREKQIPKRKEPTRWEQFARKKSIKRRKKDFRVFDEQSGTFKRRHGFDKANDEEKRNWVVEHKEGDDLSQDPFLKAKKAKKERTAKNKKNQFSNLKRDGVIKTAIDKRLKTAKVSTASMGIFDKKVKGEEKVKAVKQTKQKRKPVLDEKARGLKILKRIGKLNNKS